MPVMRCALGKRRGFKWGHSGKCYVSRAKAIEQMKAILASGWKHPVKGKK